LAVAIPIPEAFRRNRDFAEQMVELVWGDKVYCIIEVKV
jgi:hypothetical protein